MMDCIKDNLTNRFTTLYNKNPEVFFSPAQVNLIGEHTDYNNDFVMPFAINKGVFISIVTRMITLSMYIVKILMILHLLI